MEILKLYRLKIELELKKVCQDVLGVLVALAPAGASEENPHDWTLFIRPSRAERIKEMHTHLNPTVWDNDSVQQQDLISLL
ncbi:hypothetical protein PG996_010645 [Apiospora saccharicola]|uniref:Uncharacterized protein n=1 Tax=Apiospora saccharicola TaxID=335842 RepID=A0ABR1UP61_9PEZI